MEVSLISHSDSVPRACEFLFMAVAGDKFTWMNVQVRLLIDLKSNIDLNFLIKHFKVAYTKM